MYNKGDTGMHLIRTIQKFFVVITIGLSLNAPIKASLHSSGQQEAMNKSLMIGQYSMPRSNNRFWFYVDNIEKQLKVKLEQKDMMQEDRQTLNQLLREAQIIKKSRVTYKEVRDYLESNNKKLSDFSIIDPHENGFKD